MSSTAELRVIDTDTHVTEPPDLWTSRVPSKWVDAVPRVKRHPDTGRRQWRLGDRWLSVPGAYARSGWTEFPPVAPTDYDQIDPGAWRPVDRLSRMDQYGVYSHVLHPNLLGKKTACSSTLACTRTVQRR